MGDMVSIFNDRFQKEVPLELNNFIIPRFELAVRSNEYTFSWWPEHLVNNT